jgi:ribosomal protein L37AE/L43A
MNLDRCVSCGEIKEIVEVTYAGPKCQNCTFHEIKCKKCGKIIVGNTGNKIFICDNCEKCPKK